MQVARKQIQQIFLNSRQRYIGYYLQYSEEPSHLAHPLEQELANLQRAFHWAIEDYKHDLVARFWEAIGDFFWEHGYWQNYLEWGETALNAVRQLGRRETEAWVISELGWLRLEQGEFAKSKKLLDQAHSIFNTIPHTRGLCTVERYLGVWAYRTGDLTAADEHYATALRIASEGELAEKHRSASGQGTEEDDYTLIISEIRNLQGSVAKRKGDLTKARQYYEESVRLVNLKGDRWRLAAALRNLARLEFQLGNLNVAKEQFKNVIALCQEVDRKDMLYGCQLGLAEVELKLGNVDHARMLAASARHGFEQLGLQRDLANATRFLNDLAAASTR